MKVTSTFEYGGVDDLSALERKQLWAGFQPHRWEDDQTIEDLFDWDNEDGKGAQDCSKTIFSDGKETFTMYTYGMGDNEFGSIHRGKNVLPIITIYDGDLQWAKASTESEDGKLLKAIKRAKRAHVGDDYSTSDDDDDDAPKSKRAKKPAGKKSSTTTTSTGSGAAIAPPKKEPEAMTVTELKAELEKRSLSTVGVKTALLNRLNADIKSRKKAHAKVDPNSMTAQELRDKCEELGLETTGDKRVLIHRVSVELKRLSGKDTSSFDPNLLTVTQLIQWLEKRKVHHLKSKSKDYYVDLVTKTVDEEDEEKKTADVQSMSVGELMAWLKDHSIRCPAGRKKKFYQDLVEANMDEHSGLLFKEDDILYHKKLFFGQRLVVVQGDISTCKAGCVVHPTNGSLTLGGGVGKALAAASGAKFKKEVTAWVSSHKHLAVGGCCLTKGHELECDYVIHTHSPVYDKSNIKASRAALAESINSILKLASKHKLHTIALPSIGSGVNGYPADVAAETILRAITDFFQAAGVVGSSIQEVYFVLFDDASVDVYSESLVNL